MKAKSNRRKKRGIKALFCFLLAAELTLGSLSTPAQAEASEITETEASEITEPKTEAEASKITTPEETPEPTDSTPSPKDEEPETGKQEPTEPEEPPVDKPPTEEPPVTEPPVEEPPIGDLPKCTCKILCPEDSFNAKCPVCIENPSLCAGTAPQEETPVTVTEEAPQAALLSDSEEEPQSEPFLDRKEGHPPLYYRVVAGGVEVAFHDSYLSPDFSNYIGSLENQLLEIPDTVFDGTKDYSVVGIGEDAFKDCTSLRKITIPKTVTEIGDNAFYNCRNLLSITIPADNTVTTIGDYAFYNCKSLSSITIPNHITELSLGLFTNCDSLTEITIPSSVNKIWNQAIFYCPKLTKVTILNDSVELAYDSISTCHTLNRLSIAVKSDADVTPVKTTTAPFMDTVAGRRLTFLTEDGSKSLDATTTPTFEEAKAKYDEGGDGKDGDGMWWGWIISEDSEEPEPPAPATYTVTIQAQLNGIPWNEFPWDGDPWNKVPWSGSDHPKKTFALKKADGTYLEDFTAEADGKYSITVADGEYEIYERIETPKQTAAREVSYRPANVTVDKDHPNATVNYYTATFYDGSDLYDNRTDQRPQIVLEGTCVAEPPNPPDKSGLSFDKWKTEDKGSTDFNFAETKLAAPTNIYASWKATAENPGPFHITAKAHGEGSISPEGDIEVTKGRNYTFTIEANADYRIESVITDSFNRGAIDSYTFTNVEKDHTIDAYFVKKAETGGGGTGPDNPGGGGGSDPDDSDDDHSGGGTSDSGSGAGNSGGSISDGGSAGSTNISAGSSLPEAGAPAKTAGTVSGTNVNSARPGEPKTGDASHLEVYASIAMIAGFVYLILYLMDGMKGMSEEEKNRRIASLLGWAKRGRARTLRRYIAITAVFFVLAYYHAFGKRAALEWQKA